MAWLLLLSLVLFASQLVHLVSPLFPVKAIPCYISMLRKGAVAYEPRQQPPLSFLPKLKKTAQVKSDSVLAGLYQTPS